LLLLVPPALHALHLPYPVVHLSNIQLMYTEYFNCCVYLPYSACVCPAAAWCAADVAVLLVQVLAAHIMATARAGEASQQSCCAGKIPLGLRTCPAK
jgi:hypothetical protein